MPGVDHPPQRSIAAEQMILTDDLVEFNRTEPIRQRAVDTL